MYYKNYKKCLIVSRRSCGLRLSCGRRGKGNSLQAVVLVLERLRVSTGAINIGGGSGGGGGGGTAVLLFFSDEWADTNTLSSELNELRIGRSTWEECVCVCLDVGVRLIVVRMDIVHLVGGSWFKTREIDLENKR